ncbi:MAG: hypothetical protein QOG87_402 [Actinomycetota bacterium]|jgi:M6 family metalloprotease-like protein
MPERYEGQEFTFFDPDGSEIPVRGWGNQFAAVFETLDGYTVVQDPDSRFFHYADLSPDGAELVPSGNRAADADPAVLGLARHIRVNRESFRTEAMEAFDAAATTRWRQRLAERRARTRSAAQPGPEAAPPPQGTTGDYVGLCLLVQFPDVPGTIARDEVEAFCNRPGYAGFGNNGSAHDYFLEVSGGKLRYTNQVAAYYTARHNRAHYTDPAVPFGTRAKQLIAEALDALKASGFDFSRLSSDDDGFIYALSVFYAGRRINNWSQGLWPHSWALDTAYQASPAKRFSDYQITDMGDKLTLRTFCHENGHMVCDFPDLYDYGSESSGIGHFCLMCAGASDTNPAHVSAYLKYRAGWASSVTPLAPGTTAAVTAGTNEFLIRRKNAAEYFILENRQRAGRDSALPDAGLAIWHVDELGTNSDEQMTAAKHYECSLEQADNRFDLEHGTNAGDAGDLFGSPAARFGRATTPDSRWWNGGDSNLEITSISAPGPTITVTTA